MSCRVIMTAGDANLYCNVQRCICLDTDFCPQLYLEKANEKGRQHVKLEEAATLNEYVVTSLSYVCGSTGSQHSQQQLKK